MSEEKSLKKYNEKKGFIQWLKSGFEKLKERFSPAKDVEQSQPNREEGEELSEEQLDDIRAGYPNPDVLDIDSIKNTIDNIQPKSNPWELTKEELDQVKAGYPNIAPEEYQPKQGEQELSQEDLDSVIAGQPYTNSEQESAR